ncbi:hypothetical protein K9S39_08375 [Streptomyces halobius]|uniref:Beta-ketoacyl synthase-like N-terminal domain-containing protein n=1 Tax=Streptomyces halobius TaxID=2879846 RepID=A0ABY4M335_9ACTN|nr:hypothetical protein K9S39_08375 [Streptomyces halobius]
MRAGADRCRRPPPCPRSDRDRGPCRNVPQGAGHKEFWDNIVMGRDCSQEVPEAWWSTNDHYDPDPFAEERTYCRRGGS